MRFDRNRTQYIRRQCNVQETGEWIARRRGEWYERISRTHQRGLRETVLLQADVVVADRIKM
jgi:hypothetical protein